MFVNYRINSSVLSSNSKCETAKSELNELKKVQNKSLEAQQKIQALSSSELTSTLSSSSELPPLPHMSHNRSIVYVHCGKSGGLTLQTILPAYCMWLRNGRENCLQKVNTKSLLSSLVKKHIHTKMSHTKNIWDFLKHNTTSFLFTLRQPVSRTVSSFYYSHPENYKKKIDYLPITQFYTDCFPIVEDLASVLARKIHKETIGWKNETIDCFDIGKNALQGTVNEMVNAHLLWNLKRYVQSTVQSFPDMEILVVRTEKLWDDIIDLNVQLGGEKDDFTAVLGMKRDHGSSIYKVSSGLSEEGTEVVCCFLYNENEIYEDLITRSLNLNQAVKDEALDTLYSNCGINRAERGEEFTWTSWAAEKNCV